MNELSIEYKGISLGCQELGTKVPSHLAKDMAHAQEKLRCALGNDVSGFVAKRLHFSREELFEAMAMEQIDGVAMAIYNIEMRSQSIIIGDQTGIGKGRQAAAMIRYGMLSGYLPVFFTDRYTLFSDMYRDCKALGIQEARPLIVNSGVSVVDFDKAVETEPTVDDPDEIWSPSMDEDENIDDSEQMAIYQKQYEVVYRSLKKKEMELIYRKGDIPNNCYEYLMMTYSQLKDAKKDRTRLEFLMSLGKKHRLLFIFDEAHKSSSVSAGNISVITQSINATLEECPDAQCVFLSATFAKRPECMITFMQRTVLSALATKRTLQDAFANGGVPMQEYVSSMLASEGQMIRREHSNDGIPTPIYTYLDDDITIHSELFDRVMYWFRELVTLSQMVADAIALARLHQQIEDWGLYPTRAQLFYVNKVLLLALKAKTIADKAVGEVRQGRSVVIGMSDTLECILQDVEKDEDGNCRGDFSAILLRLLEKTIRDTHSGMSLFELGIDDETGELSQVIDDALDYYKLLKNSIKEESFHLPLSPIDVIRQLVTAEMFEAPDGSFINVRFEECTGRAHRLEYLWPDGQDDFTEATVVPRKKRHSNQIFNDFQNNKLDVILINACGAIGASAHAIATAEVSKDQVRQRKMLIVQTDLDVNIDLQKRGRINRTGQRTDLPPLYEYIITAIPSEKRLNMMLRAKLRSLSANTTANQDQDQAQADFIDLSNKYGNQVARKFLVAHPELSFVLGLTPTSSLTASRLMARLAMLSVAAQQDAIDELFSAYQTLETDLRRINQWDLEREHRDFEAVFVREELFTAALDDSRLGGGSYLTSYRCRHRTFPYDSKTLLSDVADAKQRHGESLKKNPSMQKEIDTYYRQLRNKLKSGMKERQGILLLSTQESLKKYIVGETLIQELVDLVQQSNKDWRGEAKRRVQNISRMTSVLHRLESFSKERQTIKERYDKNLKKINDESRRLRTILSAAEIGSVYDMTGFVEIEMVCERIWGVLKDIRFGKNPNKKFLPSNVDFVFALSAGTREITINLVHTNQDSNYFKLTDIIINGRKQKFYADLWDSEIAKYNNRVLERKIVTGNILSAYCHPAVTNLNPRFITFTLAPNEKGEKHIMHGLLMPMDEKRLKEELSSVSLPLTDGLRYANSTSTVYPITSLDARFSLMPVRSYRDGELLFRISVDDKSSKAFEEPEYEAIRGYFKSEPITSTISEKTQSAKNLNNRRQRKRYFTDNMEFDSEVMQTIVQFLAQMRATIVVPRNQITIGEMKQMESQSEHDENKAWPVLDWEKEKEQPLPPSRQEVLLHITPPLVKGNSGGREVQSLSEYVLLCRETVKMQGCSMADNSTRLKVKKLYFDWRNLFICLTDSKDEDKAKTLRYLLLDELHNLLIGKSEKIQLECYDRLCQAADSEHLDAIVEIRERFNKEFLFMSPPKEQVKVFIDSCPCSDRLNYIIKALQKYLNGETEIIN